MLHFSIQGGDADAEPLRCEALCILPALALREELELAAKRMKVRDMALDLTALDRVDTTGLGVLVGVSTKARSWGKRLMLYRAPQNVLDLLERVEISGFFPLLDDENDLKARQLYKRA